MNQKTLPNNVEKQITRKHLTSNGRKAINQKVLHLTDNGSIVFKQKSFNWQL